MPLVRRTRATLRSAEFGFFGRGRVDARAHAAPLRAALERRRLGLADLVLPALADQLLDRGHRVSVFVFCAVLYGGMDRAGRASETRVGRVGGGLERPALQRRHPIDGRGHRH